MSYVVCGVWVYMYCVDVVDSCRTCIARGSNCGAVVVKHGLLARDGKISCVSCAGGLIFDPIIRDR